MNPQTPHSVQPTVTMFLKPAFLMTAHGSGLQVSVTLQAPSERPKASA